jgi:CRISPR-associated endonuclease Csn1
MSKASLSNPWRLGLDIGVGSIGWAVLDLKPTAKGDMEPTRLRDLGVTIFSSGADDDQQTAGMEWRKQRLSRKRYHSVKKRKTELLRRLVAQGCLASDPDARRRERDSMKVLPDMPKSAEIPAIWAFRYIALRQPGRLRKNELGHILMALAASRGQAFSPDSESENLLERSIELQERIRRANCIAFGDYAAEILSRERSATIRARNLIPNLCSRAMVRQEFDEIESKQYALLPEDVWAELRELIFDQNRPIPLAAGRCPLVEGEERLARAHPLAQRLKILQTLRNIILREHNELEQRPLRDDEVRAALAYLDDKRECSPNALMRKIGLGRRETNFHEKSSGTASPIPGNETNANLSKAQVFGPEWYKFSLEKRQEIVDKILCLRGSGKKFRFRELGNEWGVDEGIAENAFRSLPRGRSAFGITATCALVEELEGGKTFYEARLARFPDRIEPETLRFNRLPYYGIALPQHVFVDSNGKSDEERFGRVRNPRVHVVLNQLRSIVNALCDAYGKPDQIVVELAREFRNSEKDRQKIRTLQEEKRKKRERARIAIEGIGIIASEGQVERYLLWEELGPMGERRDVYSGELITDIRSLMSNDVEVEHIIPRSLSGDDSLANKTVTYHSINQDKGNRTPYEYFTSIGKYDEMYERAKNVSEWNKRKLSRFSSGARENFCGKFSSRELNETSFASKLARSYLATLIGSDRVHTTRGSITGRLRKAWALADVLPQSEGVKAKIEERKAAKKEIPKELKRHDHRHHAVDAALVGLIDPQRLEWYFRLSEDVARERPALPWTSFREELQSLIAMTIVRHRPSHKPGHSYAGPAVEATRYRLFEKDGKTYIRTRVSLLALALDRDGVWNLPGNATQGWIDKQFNRLAPGQSEKNLREIFTEENLKKKSRVAYEDLVAATDTSNDGIREDRQRDSQAKARAWRQLCDDFALRTGGTRSIHRFQLEEDPVRLADGKSAMVSAGNAYAEVIKRTSQSRARENDRIKYDLRVIQRGKALRGEVSPSPVDGAIVCRLHRGDMLRLVIDGQQRYVVVKVVDRDGRIGLALHNNAARDGGRLISIDDNIEKSVRQVHRVFGDWRARIVRLNPLGRMKSD